MIKRNKRISSFKQEAFTESRFCVEADFSMLEAQQNIEEIIYSSATNLESESSLK